MSDVAAYLRLMSKLSRDCKVLQSCITFADDAKTQHMLLRLAIAYATKANLANLLGPVIKVKSSILQASCPPQPPLLAPQAYKRLCQTNVEESLCPLLN